MTSVVSICNLALTRIGAQTINDLEEASSAARHCKALYEPTRDALLQMYPWRFARQRVVLAALALTEADQPREWAEVYALPSDCLQPVYIEPQDAGPVYAYDRCHKGAEYWRGQIPDATPPYEVRAGRRIMTDEEEAVLIYTARIEDPTRFDPLFVEALSWRLAADLATALKGDIQRRREALGEAVTAINQAAATDGMAATNRMQRDADWVSARL
ncbi:MAG: hypothetical protein ACTS10_10985 [Kiloniellales bacterium]